MSADTILNYHMYNRNLISVDTSLLNEINVIGVGIIVGNYMIDFLLSPQIITLQQGIDKSSCFLKVFNCS